MNIDIFSDVVCPWCFIGTRRLQRALASFDPPVDVTIRHHPFLLDPDTPAEGKNIAEYLRTHYGRDPRPMFASVEAAARDSGIALDLSKQAYSYPTVAAHTLLRHAPDPAAQQALADALFVAHFIEARNVSDVDVLVDIASRHGFDPAVARRLVQDEAELEETRMEAGRAAASGIRGVPFFVFDNRLAVSGGQREEVFRDAIQQVLAVSATSHS